MQDVTTRRGNSALYSSIRYLGEDTDYETTLIGWTGEVHPKIRRPWERKPQVPKNPVYGVANGQLDDLANGETAASMDPGHPDEPAKDLVCLTKADKRKFEEKLKTFRQTTQTIGERCNVVPIWTLEDADGQPQGTVAESPDTQTRFRKYADQGMSYVTINSSPLATVALCSMERNRRTTGEDMVARLCKVEPEIRPENRQVVPTWRYQYVPCLGCLTIVWIHDYFLALLPQMIKKEIPNAYIGLFMHAPFPSSEYFRCLPSMPLYFR
jgi:trehalose 6-phosphate synthase/phosphatase